MALARSTAVVYPANVGEVQQVIRCARKHRIDAVPRGGGHSYDGELQHGTKPPAMATLRRAQGAAASPGCLFHLLFLQKPAWDPTSC